MKVCNEKFYKIGIKSSKIRECMTYAMKLKNEIGADKVYDFSIGNPNAPIPQKVKDTFSELVKMENNTYVHGYTATNGDAEVRNAIANYYTEKYKIKVEADGVFMTCGAAAALTIALSTVKVNDDDEMIVLCPFFTEYEQYAKATGLKVRRVNTDLETFNISIEELEKNINEHTACIIINNPCNPTGVVYDKETLTKVCDILRKKENEYQRKIYIVSDEPYRELVYDGVKVEYLPGLYDDTIITYSYSKILSLPGDRIGFIMVTEKTDCRNELMQAIKGASLIFGYVCAPTLLQRVIARNQGVTTDIGYYEKNKEFLYKSLLNIGYKVVKPQGAMYLFMKALEDDANKFVENAKKFNLVLVPSDDFGVTGFVRIAYCIPYETIVNSIEAFENLYKMYV